MKTLLEKSRFLLFGIVAASFVAFVAILVWGIVKTLSTVWEIATGLVKGAAVTVSFVELMDTFLIAAVFYIFAVAIYELFIGDLDLPSWLTIHNLDELKSKVINIVVLVIGIVFLEHFIEWENSRVTLENGIAAAVVIGALILFNYVSHRHSKSD